MFPWIFDVLFPEDWRGQDHEGYADWEQETSERVRDLALELRDSSAAELAELIAHAEREAAVAEITYPRLTPQFARVLASSGESPDQLLAELQRNKAPTELLLPFLERAIELGVPDVESVLEHMVLDPRTCWVAVQCVLAAQTSRHIKELAISHMTPAYKNLIEILIVRGEIDVETLKLLLSAPDPLVRRDTAVALGHARSGTRPEDLPDALRARWREVILASTPDDFWFAEILKADPELFAGWLRAWFLRLKEQANYEFLPPQFEESVCELPLEVRVRLIREAPADVQSFYLQDVMKSLVSDDVETATALLEGDDLQELHWTALRDGPSEAWLRRAKLAIERGWDPRRIVANTLFAESGWSGEESMHWQTKIDEFEKLGQHSQGDAVTETLVAAGIEFFTGQRAEAAERERRERVFGLRQR